MIEYFIGAAAMLAFLYLVKAIVSAVNKHMRKKHGLSCIPVPDATVQQFRTAVWEGSDRTPGFMMSESKAKAILKRIQEDQDHG